MSINASLHGAFGVIVVVIFVEVTMTNDIPKCYCMEIECDYNDIPKA